MYFCAGSQLTVSGFELSSALLDRILFDCQGIECFVFAFAVSFVGFSGCFIYVKFLLGPISSITDNIWRLLPMHITFSGNNYFHVVEYLLSVRHFSSCQPRSECSYFLLQIQIHLFLATREFWTKQFWILKSFKGFLGLNKAPAKIGYATGHANMVYILLILSSCNLEIRSSRTSTIFCNFSFVVCFQFYFEHFLGLDSVSEPFSFIGPKQKYETTFWFFFVVTEESSVIPDTLVGL